MVNTYRYLFTSRSLYIKICIDWNIWNMCHRKNQNAILKLALTSLVFFIHSNKKSRSFPFPLKLNCMWETYLLLCELKVLSFDHRTNCVFNVGSLSKTAVKSLAWPLFKHTFLFTKRTNVKTVELNPLALRQFLSVIVIRYNVYSEQCSFAM